MSDPAVTVSDLRESNDLLDDPGALRQRLLDDGYLFLRDVLDPAAVEAVRKGFMVALAESGVTSGPDSLTWTGKVVPEYYQHPREVAEQKLWENFGLSRHRCGSR